MECIDLCQESSVTVISRMVHRNPGYPLKDLSFVLHCKTLL